MPARLVPLTVAAHDPAALARFWAGVLGWEPVDGRRFEPPDDLTSATLEDQRSTVARAPSMGGRHCDVGQLPGEEHVVLADPEDDEFCVIEPGIGALSSDGSQEVGHFWSQALGWPLVWDQDQETAIQSLHGGPEITWCGPPVRRKVGRNRLHFDLAPSSGDQAAEIERLVSLGATRTDDGPGGSVAMADPDGNVFCVLPVDG